MTWWLALVLAQDPEGQAARVRAAMQESIEKQKASVRQQMEAVAVNAPAVARIVPMSHPVPEYGCDPISKPELTKMVDEAAQQHGVSSQLILEVARQESGFHPCAVSPKGAEGLMQLMPATQADLQVVNPFDARENLQAGSKLLKELLERYHGDLSLALSAYNAGAGRVDRAGGIPEIPETKNYVVDILSRLVR